MTVLPWLLAEALELLLGKQQPDGTWLLAENPRRAPFTSSSPTATASPAGGTPSARSRVRRRAD